MAPKEVRTTLRESSPAKALSFQPVSSMLQKLVQPPAPVSIVKHDPGEVNHLQEGGRVCDLLSKLSFLLGQTDVMLERNQISLEMRCTKLHQLLAQLTKLQTTDRLLNSIECSNTCIAQINDPACLQCLLNAHSALSIPSLSVNRNVSLEKQRQCIALSIREHFSMRVREALDKILASSLRACHETRAQTHLMNMEASDQLASLLSSLRVENTVPISVHWNDQLFYMVLCRETAIVCESLSSLALSLSDQIKRCMHVGNSEPLTALFQVARSFVSAYAHAFSVSFPTELTNDNKEAGLLLSKIEQMGPYFSARLKLTQAKRQPHLINRLLRRSTTSPLKAYVERIRQNFSGLTAWAPPYPEPGQSLMFNSSAAERWHITGIGQLFVDFLVLFLGSIFDAFTLSDQISTFPFINLYFSNNPVTEESELFMRVFTTYSGIIANETEGIKIVK